jgi:hypothetical protein
MEYHKNLLIASYNNQEEQSSCYMDIIMCEMSGTGLVLDLESLIVSEIADNN